jgi:hypothetical protein
LLRLLIRGKKGKTFKKGVQEKNTPEMTSSGGWRITSSFVFFLNKKNKWQMLGKKERKKKCSFSSP